MTAQALADRCAELGLPLDRAVIAKLEKGLRQSLTVAELLVLAKALGVPPIQLVFAVGHDDVTEVLPGQAVDTWEAAKWFTGEGPFPCEDSRSAREAWQTGGAAVNVFRSHDAYMAAQHAALDEADSARRMADAASTEAERARYVRLAELHEADALAHARNVRRTLDAMGHRGLTPPKPRTPVQYVDTDTPA